MAHKIKVDILPHTNKDGSPSKTKRDYIITDRGRKGRREVGICTSQKAADMLIEEYRSHLSEIHLNSHPNDKAYRAKHKIKVDA